MLVRAAIHATPVSSPLTIFAAASFARPENSLLKVVFATHVPRAPTLHPVRAVVLSVKRVSPHPLIRSHATFACPVPFPPMEAPARTVLLALSLALVPQSAAHVLAVQDSFQTLVAVHASLEPSLQADTPAQTVPTEPTVTVVLANATSVLLEHNPPKQTTDAHSVNLVTILTMV